MSKIDLALFKGGLCDGEFKNALFVSEFCDAECDLTLFAGELCDAEYCYLHDV